MFSVTSAINWAGNKVTDFVYGEIDQRLNKAGQKFVDTVHATVHVKTGEMRAGAYYRVENRTLVLGDTSPHTIFEALGTRYRPGHPQYLDAINSIGPLLGADVHLDFVVPQITSPVLAHAGRMIVPGAIHPRPLTQAQHRQVQANQAAYRKRYKGVVKRARLRVRRFD